MMFKRLFIFKEIVVKTEDSYVVSACIRSHNKITYKSDFLVSGIETKCKGVKEIGQYTQLRCVHPRV